MEFPGFSLLIAALCLGLSLLYLAVFFVRRYQALSHVPGPRLAAWTDFWLHYKYRSNVNAKQLYRDLRKQYGPTFRYGPNRVMFSDIAAVPIIYGTTNVFEKAPAYDIPIVKVNGKLTRSMATFRDEKFVSAVKRQIVPSFSSNAVRDYEHHIDLTVEAFLDIMDVKGPNLDLMPILSFFSFDTICRLAFSDAMNLMSNQADLGNVLEGGRERFRYWHQWFAIPAIESLIMKNRFMPSMSAVSQLGALAKKRLEDRMEKGGVGNTHDLLDRFLQARQKDPATFTVPTVVGLTISTIHAGSETTAHTLGNTFWDLLENPEIYRRLKSDIRGAGFSSPPTEAEVRKVPFIEACIKESMRLHNLLTDPIERSVPARGATICGVWVPGGTVVSINAAVLAHDNSVYGDDAEVYNPERWLKGTAQQHAAMERGNFAFSQGKRNCIGSHIAWAEMLKLLSALLKDFDIELACPDAVRKVEGAMMNFTQDLPVMVTPLRK